ncbi:MAG TPA: DNA primase [Lentisphaeria bacterium]|nr:MAG: DNA primase [Lentisphaerae bacterium ADurb.Bin082]HPY90161.1 DNA primase [Lentisphaeria bacterium]HQL86939.1 DNA primase [Lentisphaeria bacterium]
MAHIPEEFIDQLRQRTDIADVVGSFTQVKKRGSDYWACCPFHKEKTPSFKMDSQRQTFYCFGCKKSGNLFHFIQEMVNTDFVGAVHWLADRYGLTVPETRRRGDGAASEQRRQWREQGQKLLNEAADWYHHLLKQPEAEKARAYLKSREIDDETIEKFNLGYCLDSWDALCQWASSRGYSPELLEATGMVSKKDGSTSFYDRFRDRLIFPIHDELSRVVGFSARLLAPDAKAPKYVNSPETDFFQKSSILYGLNHARASLKTFGHALVCEGQLDVIACHRAGLSNAVAAQGTAFTENHARLLKRSTSNIVLAFDPDTAGTTAAQRTIALLHEVGLTVSVVSLPLDEDPDSIFRHGGAEALRSIMSATEPAVPYLFRRACDTHDLNQPEGKSLIATDVLTAIRPLADPIARTAHCQWLATQLNLPENIVFDALNSLQASHARHSATSFQPPTAPADRAPTPLPTFTMPEDNEKVWQTIFDLVLHFENLALLLADDEEITRLLPDTPLGMAISRVLACVDQDSWPDAADSLCHDDLIRHPTVGAVIAKSAFPYRAKPKATTPVSTLSAEPEEEEDISAEKTTQAYEDCRKKLQLAELARISQEKQLALQTAEGEEAKRLMRELTELNRKKRLL